VTTASAVDDVNIIAANNTGTGTELEVTVHSE
jgi:hypothetical protein